MKTQLKIYEDVIKEIRDSIKKINDELGDIDRRLSRLEGRLLNNPNKKFKLKDMIRNSNEKVNEQYKKHRDYLG